MEKEKKIILYWHEDDLYCKRLIQMMMKVPMVARKVKCINIKKYDDTNIPVPTIDDGKIYELEDAFLWVLDEINRMLEIVSGFEQLSSLRDAEKEVKQDIRDLFRHLQKLAQKDELENDQRIDHNSSPKAEDFEFRSFDDCNFGKLDYSGKHRTKDLLIQSQIKVSKTPKDNRTLEQKIKTYEDQRESLRQFYINKWKTDKPDIVPRTIQRENLKRDRIVTETDIKRLVGDREKMLLEDDVPYVKEPIQRQIYRSGISITDKDLKGYEHYRRTVSELIQNLKNHYSLMPSKVSKTSKKRSPKEKKEPKKKRAPTAYAIFVGEYIREGRNKKSSSEASQLMKDAAKKWKTLSKDEKSKYTKKALKLKKTE